MAAHTDRNKSIRKGKRFKKSGGKGHGTTFKKWELEIKETKKLESRYENINISEVTTFDDLPLCRKTLASLHTAGYHAPTEIQRMSIGLALQGNDVLGAAKTGSGKTLAFLIPVLECLFRSRWSAEDGLGALVISPTRELAYQTFEVLCKVGKKHDFSAGLIIGGKDLGTEMERIPRTNIVVCTPGRLLQHMDQTVSFECSNLKILVLDEADRILDLGFEKTMNGIIDNLPPDRQTLLFSATQTKSVRDLARLSLKDPKYVAVHQHHEYSTPSQLEQSYVVCDLEQKADLLYSFIRNHREKKILVFMTSCKQVKYMFEVFCKLRPGTTIMALYGGLNQMRRVSIYNEFCKRQSAVLFATDIAARGLDFPSVNWVVQLDCPEDANTYIHRAGRTARYEHGGEALLVLLPSEEEEMTRMLADKKIPIEKISVNPNKKMTIQRKLESFCAEDYELKASAQRCFISYIKSIYLMKNKKVFDVKQIDLDTFALSLGLAIPPRVRFLQREEKRKQLQQQQKILNKKSTSDNIKDSDESTKVKGQLKKDKPEVKDPGLKRMGSEDSDGSESGGVSDESDDVSGFKESMLKALTDTGAVKSRTPKDVDSNKKSDKSRTKVAQIDEEKSEGVGQLPRNDSSSGSDEDSDDDEEEKEEEEPGLAEEKAGAAVGFHGNSDDEEQDDDGDDLFTVKKNDVFGLIDKSKAIVDSDEEYMQEAKHVNRRKKEEAKRAKELEEEQNDMIAEEEAANPKKKAVTAIKVAKKLIKKKLKVNTKMVFDEEGEVTQQWPPRQKTVTQDDDGAPEYEGGIDIDKAKDLLRKEDYYDRKADRERIKEKHRARRLKEKEERRAKRGEGGAGEGGSLGPTLGFTGDTFDPDTLPDPMSWKDGQESDDEREDAGKPEAVDDDDEDEMGEEPRSEKNAKKRKHGEKDVASDKKNSKKRMNAGDGDEEEQQLGFDMTLHEDEELALHILANR